MPNTAIYIFEVDRTDSTHIVQNLGGSTYEVLIFNSLANATFGSGKNLCQQNFMLTKLGLTWTHAFTFNFHSTHVLNEG